MEKSFFFCSFFLFGSRGFLSMCTYEFAFVLPTAKAYFFPCRFGPRGKIGGKIYRADAAGSGGFFFSLPESRSQIFWGCWKFQRIDGICKWKKLHSHILFLCSSPHKGNKSETVGVFLTSSKLYTSKKSVEFWKWLVSQKAKKILLTAGHWWWSFQ